MILCNRLQRFVGWLGTFDELRRPVNAAPVHAVQHQAVKVNVEVGRRAKALDQRDRAAVGFVWLAPSLGCAASSRRKGMGSLMTQMNTYWRTGTWGMTWSTRCAAVCAMRRAPDIARWTKAASLAIDGDQFFVAAVAAVQAQEAMREDAVLQEGVELLLPTRVPYRLRSALPSTAFCRSHGRAPPGGVVAASRGGDETSGGPAFPHERPDWQPCRVVAGSREASGGGVASRARAQPEH